MSIRIALLALTLMSTAVAVAQISAPAKPAAGEPMANSGIKLDQSPLFKAADANQNGKISKTEWTAVNGTESIFDYTDKDKDGFLTLAELNSTTPPDMADADKDGKFTVAEFQAMLKASAPAQQ